MDKKKTSALQKKREHKEARQKKADDLRLEYRERERILNELATRPPKDLDEEIPLIAAKLLERRVFGIEFEDEFLAKELKTWEDQQPLLVTGVYKDRELIKAKHRQRFIDRLRNCTPRIFDDLATLIPLYEAVFKGCAEAMVKIFDWHQVSLLAEPNTQLHTYVASLLYTSFESQGIRPSPIELQTYWSRDFKYDYRWGDFRTLLQFADLLESPLNVDARRSVISSLEGKLKIREGVISRGVAESLVKPVSEFIVDETLAKPSDAFFHNEIIRILRQIFSDSLSEPPARIYCFVRLHTRVMNWAEQHFLEKDWILNYAYYFLWKWSELEVIDYQEVPTPYFGSPSLFTDEFRFTFDAWLPGRESPESYKDRVKQKLEESLDKFFQYWARHLNLNKLQTGHVPGTTRPSDPDMESMKWLIAWNEGATYVQIAEYFHRLPATIKTGIWALEEYALPIRVGKSGRRRSPVPLNRLTEINLVK